MANLLKAARRTRRRTNSVFNNPPKTVAIKMSSASVLGAVLTVGFDQPISLNGVPAYTTDVVGATALSAVMVGTNTIAITYDSADRGKQATYFARWGGKRNQFGQWSLPLAVTIAA